MNMAQVKEMCAVADIARGKTVFFGTEQECRRYVRTHYSRWHRIYRADGSIARG